MSFGMSAEEAQIRMKQLGDISQGDAEKFKSLTLAFAQMSSTGKLTGQDLMQMINAGFNPLEEISRKTGKSIGELKEEMSKGQFQQTWLRRPAYNIRRWAFLWFNGSTIQNFFWANGNS